jgi:hypothetical protein
MAEMTEVIVFTVTGVDVAKMEQFRSQFSNIGRAVKVHQRFGNLYFSALKPVNEFTPARWAGILRDVCSSPNPVRWEIEEVMDW